MNTVLLTNKCSEKKLLRAKHSKPIICPFIKYFYFRIKEVPLRLLNHSTSVQLFVTYPNGSYSYPFLYYNYSWNSYPFINLEKGPLERGTSPYSPLLGVAPGLQGKIHFPSRLRWSCLALQTPTQILKDPVRGAYRDMKKFLTYHSKRHQLILNAIVSAQHGFSDMFQIANDTVFIIVTVVQVR